MTTQTSNTKKVIHGVSSQTIVTIVLGVVEIVSFSIMSRLLSRQDFGYYAAIVAVSTIFSSLSENGIGAAIVQRKKLDSIFINNAFTLSLITGVFVSGLLCSLSGVLAKNVADESMQIPLMLFSITLLLHCITSVNMALLQRELKFLVMGGINLTSLVVTTIVAIILALKGFGYYAILAKVLLSSVITVILSYIISKAKYRVQLDKLYIKQIFGFSGWLMASSLFRNLANQIDRILMSSLFSVTILGLYSRPKELITIITNKCNIIFDSTLFPVLSSIQDEHLKMVNSFKTVLSYLNIAAILLGLLFFCNSELIIRLFFGIEWLNINTLFQALSLTPVFYVNGRIGDIFLRAMGRTKVQFFFRISQLFVIVCFIYGTYSFGIIAVAFSAMVGYYIIALLKLLYVSKHIGINMSTTIVSMLKGWKLSLFIIPFYLTSYLFIPHNIICNMLMAIIFIILILLLFLKFPSCVGDIYKENAYPVVIKTIKRYIKLKI